MRYYSNTYRSVIVFFIIVSVQNSYLYYYCNNIDVVSWFIFVGGVFNSIINTNNTTNYNIRYYPDKYNNNNNNFLNNSNNIKKNVHIICTAFVGATMYLIDKYTHLQEITAKISKSNGEAAQARPLFTRPTSFTDTFNWEITIN